MQPSTTVVHLIAPQELSLGVRHRAEERAWKLLVFEPGQSLKTHLLRAECDDDAAAQEEANALLGYEPRWDPIRTGYRAGPL